MTACPALAGGAAAHAARTIPGTRDPALYAALQAAYDAARARADLPPFVDTVRPDRAWADATATRNSAERQKLEVELKNYTNNMIKESIRVRAVLACRRRALMGDRWRTATSATSIARRATTPPRCGTTQSPASSARRASTCST
jgi:hypothetical protein